MVWEESDEPPRLASAGAERCTRRKVVMKGAEIWAVFVRKGNAILRILSRFDAMFAVVVVDCDRSGHFFSGVQTSISTITVLRKLN